ncbi:MAG: DUF3052 family protein [Telluria sp.]
MSEKTIADKMYLKNVKSLAILNGEAHPRVVEQLPQDLLSPGDAPSDVVLLFAFNRKQLEELLPQALARLSDIGSLWIAYLKQTASKATDINRDTINAYCKENGVTGVAMISIDSDWSALRLKRL